MTVTVFHGFPSGWSVFASSLLEANVDPETVCRLGGWSSLAMAQCDAHGSDRQVIEAVTRLGELGARARPLRAGRA